MSTAPQWQPRDSGGRWTATGLADEAAKAQVGVKALADALKRLQAAQEAMRASESAKAMLGIKTDAQKAADAVQAAQEKIAKATEAAKAKEAAKAAAIQAKEAQRAQALQARVEASASKDAARVAIAQEKAKAKEVAIAARVQLAQEKASQRAEAARVKAADRAQQQASKAQERAAKAEQTRAAKVAMAQEKAAQKAKLAQVKAADDATKAQQAAGADMYGKLMHPVDALTGALSNMGPKGAAAAAAIKVAFVAATVAITATVGAMYELAKAAIEVTRIRGQMLATFGALSGGATGGAKTLAIVERLGKALPFATSEIAQWAVELQKAGLQGRDLEGAIKAVASATALMGESGGKAAQDLISKLALGGFEAMQLVNSLKRNLPQTRAQFAEMGLRIEDVAAAMGMTVDQMRTARISAREMSEAIQRALVKKGAGPLGDLAMQFPTMIEKVKEGFMSLFDKLGPAVKPFLKAVQSLFKEFYKGGSAIKSIKPIATEVMTAFFKYATMAANSLKGIAKAVGPTIAAIWKFLHSAPALAVLRGLVTMVQLAFTALWYTLRPFVYGFLAIVAVIGLVGTAWAGFIGTLQAVGDAIMEFTAPVRQAFSDLVQTVKDAILDFTAPAREAASDFVSGLVAGIKEGAGAVLEAVRGLASGAVAAFKGALGIASPSKVMAKMGGFAAEGVEVGLDQGASGVQASASKLGGAAATGAAGGMAGKAGAKGLTVTFAEKSIVIDGAGKAGLEITEEMIAAVFERIAATQGLMGAT